jgi:hypothetical protein
MTSEDKSIGTVLRHPGWPEARWDVSGAFVYDAALTAFHDRIAIAGGNGPFAAVHGSPSCLWNGGRVRNEFSHTQQSVEKTILGYAQRNIPIDLTFSNSSLQKRDLDDAHGNFLLQRAAEANPTGRNGVIACSELLADHVRQHYPVLKLVSSVVKVAHENGRGQLDWYRRTAERYDKVMIHPDDNFDLELLQKLEDKSRYEILVNEPCIRDCQRRKLHYALLSECSLRPHDSNLLKKMRELTDLNQCDNPDLLFHPAGAPRRTLILADSEIRRLYDLGFRNLKIQGRGMCNATAMLLELSRLILNHETESWPIVSRVLDGICESLPA